MRVFFTTPYKGKQAYQPLIDNILAFLRKQKATIITPEDAVHYQDKLERLKHEGWSAEQAHYTYIMHGIAEADVVIIEASQESFRVGHEATMALLYSKPILILSQKVDYSQYIPHQLLFGSRYQTKKDLHAALRDFLDRADDYLSKASETAHAIGGAVDVLHMAHLASLRHTSLRGNDDFSNWARLADHNPDKAYKQIQKTLGHLPARPAWSVFAQIYNEDTPDYILQGVASFIDTTFKHRGIQLSDPICDVMARTGALARNLVKLGYHNIVAFDSSREMLAEAFRLCAHLPTITITEADIADVRLPFPIKAMAWVNFSSNFATSPDILRRWITNLVANLAPGGLLIFDVRTIAGWQVNFFRQKVTTFATANFQRIWINMPNYDERMINFDIFIRTRAQGDNWADWQRERTTERMWSVKEVRDVISSIPECKIEAIYDDNFSPIQQQEPGLAYFLVKKLAKK